MNDTILFSLAILGMIPAAAIVLVVVAIAWGLVAALWRTMRASREESQVRELRALIESTAIRRGWRCPPNPPNPHAIGKRWSDG